MSSCYTLCDLNNLKSSRQATLHNMDQKLEDNMNFAVWNCMMKTQTESKPATLMNWHQCTRAKSHQHHFSWLVDIGHSSSHTVKWLSNLYDTIRVLSQAIFGGKTMITPILENCLTSHIRPLFWSPKISPHFSHSDSLSAGTPKICNE